MNAKLHPVHDKDLIDWWSNQPHGKGSAEIKAAVREYVAKGTEAAPATQGDLAKLTTQIGALVRLVAQLQQQIERGVVVQGTAAPQPPDVALLSEDEARQRRARIKDRGW
jgi:hypothetical protein